MASTAERNHRELIECYHSLLTKNLILTDDFFRTLVTHGVFSEPLINDIKVRFFKGTYMTSAYTFAHLISKVPGA